jgi:homocysteine S-methyltransferase
MTTLAQAIAAGPVVLDGGLGTLLAARGHDLSSSLWSAQLLVDDPAAIRRAHLEYFEAGARVAISSSYQVSYEGLDAAGYSRTHVDTLLARSVQLAFEARDAAGLEPGAAWVAASIGPYGATLADGSEYTGDYGLSVAELREWHRPRLEVLAAASPDVIAVETIPSLAELEAICGLLDGLGVPAWVSVTVADGALRTGESLHEALALAASIDDVIAVGVNCCDDAQVPGALEVARAAGKPGVAYPNSGELWHADTRSWSGHGSEVHRLAQSWIESGAGLIGGCCRVGPEQIAQIAQVVSARGTAE